jgi:hypothetical protein
MTLGKSARNKDSADRQEIVPIMKYQLSFARCFHCTDTLPLIRTKLEAYTSVRLPLKFSGCVAVDTETSNHTQNNHYQAKSACMYIMQVSQENDIPVEDRIVSIT